MHKALIPFIFSLQLYIGFYAPRKSENEIFFANSLADTALEGRVLDKLFRLPEVLKKNRLIDSLTNHKRGISMMIIQRPSKKSPFYVVQVGYNNEVRFETYFVFWVNKNDLDVNVEDAVTGEPITLNAWRRRKK